MNQQAWLVEARRHLGQKEFAGAGTNPFIASLWINAVAVWQALGADDSSAPWCGQFVGRCIEAAGLAIPKHPYRARAWLDWGQELPQPLVGSIVVYQRTGGGHVGFVVGRDRLGNLMTLGGNQGDRVSIAPFAMARALGYRYPTGQIYHLAPLPLLASDGRPSTNEA